MTDHEALPLVPRPTERTPPCGQFFDEYSELIDFLVFVIGLAYHLDEARNKAATALAGYYDATDRTDEAHKARQAVDDPGAMKSLSGFHRMLMQMALVRAVDNFLVYLSDMLTMVFRERPEALRSSEQVTVEFVLQHDSIDELVSALAERRVDRLAYGGMRDLAKQLEQSMGFRLFDSEDDLQRVVRLVEKRNVVVHNRGVVNSTYLRRVQRGAEAVGDRIKLSLDDVRGEAAFLAEAVARVDQRAHDKWSLPLEQPDATDP